MDATNISSFDMNVVNTKKIVPLHCSCFLARAENSGKKNTAVVNTGVCTKVQSMTRKKCAFQPDDQRTIALNDYFKALMSIGEAV